jgi:hypothetical protein
MEQVQAFWHQLATAAQGHHHLTVLVHLQQLLLLPPQLAQVLLHPGLDHPTKRELTIGIVQY